MTNGANGIGAEASQATSAYRATRQLAGKALRPPYHALRQMLRDLIPIEWRRSVVRMMHGGVHPSEAAAAPAIVYQEIEAPLDHEHGAPYDVICFPVIEWDFRFQRPQQLMTRFAEAGHRVFYLNLHFRESGPPYVLQPKGKNIYEVSLRGLPRGIYTEPLDTAARKVLFESLNALRIEQRIGAAVSCVNLPFWWPLVEQMRAQFSWPVVYDCMDYHPGFSINQPGMLQAEEQLLASADAVVVSSLFLEEQATAHNANVVLARNGCDYEHFASVVTKPPAAQPVIGYYGAIADWFDSDLVADLATQRPDWKFVLVGLTLLADLSRLSKLPNVELAGEQPYADLPQWLNRFDALIIPFKRIPLTEATNPVKAYEILAAGKPLVSVPIPEMAALGDVVQLASTVAEFEREIKRALAENSPDRIARRREFARQHTWENRYETIAPVVTQTFPKATVIIVTYNNLALNRQCLESLYQRTEWPNFEVIVVDNASTDGTPEYLEEIEHQYPNLRVILNDKNLGFAAANNMGLKIVGGEYLVLLNNDTVVSRGWLTALIRHLAADPQIGLIGPVTNSIGNDAKIPVGYQNVFEMPLWAADYIRQHDGDLFDIPMVAMFCVAMRRETFAKVGFLDERFGIGMFEDDDYNRRVKEAGFTIRCTHDSFIHHWQKSSFRLLGEDAYLKIFEENRKKYEEKWGESWKAEGIDVWKRSDLGYYRDQLAQVVERVRHSKGAVIFLPSVGWNIVLFQRPHHLARAFAQMGYVSIFDGNNAYDDVKGFKEIEPNLFLFKGPPELLNEIPDALLWSFTYNYDQRYSYPGTARVIYDWIDDLEVFPYDQKFLADNHAWALQEATVVASVAQGLHQQALAVRPDALYLPNGVEDWRFASDDVPLPDDPDLKQFLRSGRPIAGYYGALASWFDYDLIDAVARLRPDWNFLLIGPMYDESLKGRPMLTLPNVRWIGPREYHKLPGYLRLFDVATIPFVINNITLATSPLKLYEYFAGGKPVITSPMPECMAFPEVRIVRDAKEFAEALDRAREQGRDEQFRGRLRELARQNSWTARAQAAINRLPGQAQSYADAPSELELAGDALRIAERFHRFRTATNQRFFVGLANHFASLLDDPCLPMYFEFAITCNERGQKTVELLRQHVDPAGKRYLDVGCAYGGFLVAFARAGAQVGGIDIDEGWLKLARHNLQDQAVQAPLLLRDATRREDLSEFENSLDIVTCNDVIEHVTDPQALLHNIAGILREDGVACFEIPNGKAVSFVLEDGHYRLFGITLLDFPEAKRYYALHAPGMPYNVYSYFDLEHYARLFAAAGLRFEVLAESIEQVDFQAVLKSVEGLRKTAKERLQTVPADLRPQVARRVQEYLKEVESARRGTKEEKQDFLLRYGAGFWKVMARKI